MMRRHIFYIGASLALAGCASVGVVDTATRLPAETIETGPFAFTVTPPALRADASLLQAQIDGTEVLGLFNVSSQYKVQPGNWQQDSNVLGRQRWAQAFQTSLPLPFGSPISVGLNSQLEQLFTQDGVLAEQQQGLNARWNDGDLRFALDARGGNAANVSSCGLDASLSTPLPALVRDWSADAKNLRLKGQLCQRTLASGVPQKAQIFSAQTAWDDDLGVRKLRISHAVVRDQLLAGEQAAASSAIELGAQHSINLAGWSFVQELAVRSADRSEQTGAWAARSQLSRRLYSIPVTASWQRHDAAVWSLGSTQAPGTETSLGFDLSAPLQQWLSQNAGASLSYHRLAPADKKSTIDDQIRLGVSLGW